MRDLPGIYGPAFFKEWGPDHGDYVDGARRIAARIMEVYLPKRLIDLGCGCGVYAHSFRERGVDVVALDGVMAPKEHRFPVPIELRDLTEPFENPWGSFDLALCLEVAEHIPPEHVDVFLRNVTQFSDRLLLSAAPPGQGGHHHVNEQPKRYWVDRLLRHGFAYDRKATGRLVESFKTGPLRFAWMWSHLSVYDRIKEGFPLRQDMPFSFRPRRD